LAAELLGDLSDQRRFRKRGRIHRDLVGPAAQEMPGVVSRPDAPSNRHRNEDIASRFLNDVAQAVTAIEAGDAIHVDEFIGALPIVAYGVFVR
jgi:hypothetical protein